MGPDTGDAILMILGGIAVAHLIAFVAGFFLSCRKILSHIILIGIALAPIGFLCAMSMKEAHYLKHEAVYDRFKDSLFDPIPASVTDLEFVDLDESGDTHLMFRFSIDPQDLDALIEQRGFQRIEVEDFRCPIDRFRDPDYLSLGSPATFYAIEDNEMGYPEPGWGEGLTLKVNADRNQVIFRRESAAYYRYRYWESNNG
ncbi:hypothetical protein N9A94_07805 [Akkermansiaceae bacterium]|nr:hypothetical protein [Akkermansiaceae bacterium]